VPKIIDFAIARLQDSQQFHLPLPELRRMAAGTKSLD